MWNMMVLLDESRHFDILGKDAVRRLRPADPIEIQASTLTEWLKKDI
jgi:hypothetical protein